MIFILPENGQRLKMTCSNTYISPPSLLPLPSNTFQCEVRQIDRTQRGLGQDRQSTFPQAMEESFGST
jgi:hypothetical protein